ncbi:MAG: hypothetical protein LV481_06600 [Methylacidiphilales bacterium]|nr:hypothetical protein [Candidatus Methylacidiphilales bacterium]
MNWRRILIVAFWTFVVVMLAWQAYNYNAQVVTHPKPAPEQHYFYNPGLIPSSGPKVPDVRQTSYRVIPDSPQPGSFTVQFTIKNVGTATATNIQVKIRPYRGFIPGDPDNPPPGGTASGPPIPAVPLSDNDPTSQYGQWVSMPDLAPGQSNSESAVFPNQPNMSPIDSPKLEINFSPAKTN